MLRVPFLFWPNSGEGFLMEWLISARCCWGDPLEDVFGPFVRFKDVAFDVGFIAGDGRLKSKGFDRGALQLSSHDSKCLVLSPLKDGN